MDNLKTIYLSSEYSSKLAKLLSGKIIGISGVGGFLGKNWVYYLQLLNQQYNCNILIHGFDMYENIEIQSSKDFEYFQRDITRNFELDVVYDYYIHAASIASPIKYRKNPLATIDANIKGFENLIAKSLNGKISRLVLLSTSEIYGNPDSLNIPTKETYNGNVSCTGPRACYDESKRMAETLLWVYCNNFELDAVAIRPFNVYGPSQSLNDGRLIPDIMKSIYNSQEFYLYSDGLPTRTFCFISDFVLGSLLVMILGQSGEAFNIGSPEPEISVNGLLNIIQRLKGAENFKYIHKSSSDINYLVDNPMRRCPDISKAIEATGWKPQVRIDVGLEMTLASYLKEKK